MLHTSGMELNWTALGYLVGIAFVFAFGIGWFISTASPAYSLGIGFGAVLIYAPFVMARDRPFDASQSILILGPLALVWFVLGVLAVATAQELHRMLRARTTGHKG